MYVKSYDPKGKKDKKRPAKRIKAVFAKKSTRIVLFALSGALLLAAAAIFLIQWNEGEVAAEKAEELLNEVGMHPT